MGVQQTQNINILKTSPMMSPGQLRMLHPMTVTSTQTVVESRKTVEDILEGRDNRFLAIVGPCSIHDVDAALAYAEKLSQLKDEIADQIYVVMRVYFEKPRTTVGWKGLINDPDLDGSFRMEKGLTIARQLLLDITGMGLPAGTEMLEPITPQYIADLVSWASIGARTIESQTHRQLASGLSMPVGYKNGTDGNMQIALDAMRAARSPHHFLGIDEDGQTCLVSTKGNPAGHIILRGGKGQPNYMPDKVKEAADSLKAADQAPRLVVDCSHANSEKQHERQAIVWNSILEQRKASTPETPCPIIGAMLESFINPGNQKVNPDRSQMKYGVSITDACLDWTMTEELLRDAYQRLKG